MSLGWKCQICGQIFKKRSPIHITNKHGMDYKDYLMKYEMEEFLNKELIKFFEEFYITTRFKFLQYHPMDKGTPKTVNIYENKKNNKTLPVGEQKKREFGLNEADLKAHLIGKRTIGIFFPKGFTKIIGFDLDSNDISLLEGLCDTLQEFGITEENYLVSFSGKKGWHIDLFLEEMVDVEVVNKFYEMILNDMDISEKVLEIRGNSSQGYKLPYGCHFATNNHCYIANKYGIKLSEEEVLTKIYTTNAIEKELFTSIVEINYDCYLSDEEIVEFEEMKEEVSMLDIYSNTTEDRARKVEAILFSGVERGNRNKTMLEVCLYLRFYKNFCIAETKEFINNWIKAKWSKENIDKQFLRETQATIESVYASQDYYFTGSNIIKISRMDIKEIFSITTKNKLQEKALRRLYYILTIHSKAYADREGIFYMSYNQMEQMGAINRRATLKSQIKELEKMGKVIVVSANKGKKGTYEKEANKYKLLNLSDYIIAIGELSFTVCSEEIKCNDCLEKALCYLVSEKERRKHIKGKEFKQLEECPYNQK